jgi:SAM-dependent methyltransferase
VLGAFARLTGAAASPWLIRVRIGLLKSPVVELSRKIDKLRTGEALDSFLDAFYRWCRPLSVTAMVSELEAKGFARIRAKYENPSDKKGWPKYVDARHRLEVATKQARALHLDRRRPLRILDIGSGAGYFLFVCKRLGHDVMGLDLDWPAMYAEMFELMEIPRQLWRIEPFQPLPELGMRFDLVTGFAVCFNSHGSERVWSVNEWDFFLDDLRKSLLARGGEIYFELNPESWGYYTPELKEFFRSRGAVVEGKRVWFKPPAGKGARLKLRRLR